MAHETFNLSVHWRDGSGGGGGGGVHQSDLTCGCLAVGPKTQGVVLVVYRLRGKTRRKTTTESMA